MQQKHMKLLGIIVGGAALLTGVYFLLRQHPSTGDVPVKIVTEKRFLPTEFRGPERIGEPHIVGMDVRHVAVPEACKGCSIDIVQSMEGASDKAVIELNHALGGWVFEDNRDIRDPKQRILESDVKNVESLESRVVYAEGGLVTFFVAYETDYLEQAHPDRNPGTYITFLLSPLGTEFNREVVLISDKDKVLEYFYPNGSLLLEKALQDFELSGCYEGDDFPKEFYPELRPGSEGEDVVFVVHFNYGSIGVCNGMLEIAIPVSDILREVPQYVPEDSVLWGFKH